MCNWRVRVQLECAFVCVLLPGVVREPVAGLFATSAASMVIMSFDSGVPMLVPLVMFGLGYSCMPGSIWYVVHLLTADSPTQWRCIITGRVLWVRAILVRCQGSLRESMS